MKKNLFLCRSYFVTAAFALFLQFYDIFCEHEHVAVLAVLRPIVFEWAWHRII